VSFQRIEEAFKEGIAQGVFPGAVALCAKGEEVLFEQAFGFRSLVPEKSPMQVDTIFDLASLTKPLATTIGIMLLVKEKKIRLDDRVTRFFQNFGVLGKNAITFRQLLAHCSGLPGWKPYYQEIVKMEKNSRINFVASRAAKSHVFEQVHREKIISPPGSQSLYSDLDFILLGEVIEELNTSTLDRHCHEKIFRPLKLRSTSFVDLSLLRLRRIQPVQEKIAPTENCPWRKRILCGEVHDDNAYAMGGVAGHAGLFSSAREVHLILQTLRQCYREENAYLPSALVKEFLTRDPTVPGGTFALGWDTPSAENSSSGSYFSPSSVRHLGFTGTSIWWDLERDFYIVILSNRVHPLRENDKIKTFRPHIHDVIVKAILQ